MSIKWWVKFLVISTTICFLAMLLLQWLGYSEEMRTIGVVITGALVGLFYPKN